MTQVNNKKTKVQEVEKNWIQELDEFFRNQINDLYTELAGKTRKGMHVEARLVLSKRDGFAEAHEKFLKLYRKEVEKVQQQQANVQKMAEEQAKLHKKGSEQNPEAQTKIIKP